MFENFIKTGKVRKSEADKALAKSLIEMSQIHLDFASSIQITEKNASPLLVNYYESLREICEAICSLQGYKVYSHEAFTAYLNEQLKEERLAEKFDRLRKLRNGINYYGKQVSKEETQTSAEEIKQIIKELKEKYLKNLF
ncbi:hypothetical protein COV18_04140 [Candidatus Woesearchaeota archaeon CG10_big_fil_rev_8_21_14_0_10_37_12]|nr:MAG: hypothetical protein COV18_04140 [Candidatus Woesearchaeota archaeon CG10_big_fil_rev_8_21_14_0_10_37_12]